VADLIFSDEGSLRLFWKRAGQSAHFDPAPDMDTWMKDFLSHPIAPQGEG
jgi:hypothetical protein